VQQGVSAAAQVVGLAELEDVALISATKTEPPPTRAIWWGIFIERVFCSVALLEMNA